MPLPLLAVPPLRGRPAVFVRAWVRLTIPAVALLLGCASGPPTLADRSVQATFDLRLRLALENPPTEPVGTHLRVTVRLRTPATADDYDMLRTYGPILAAAHRFVTIVIPRDRLPALANEKRVQVIELALPSVEPPHLPDHRGFR